MVQVKAENQTNPRPAKENSRWNSLMRKFIASTRGATAIEYAIIAGGMSIVIIASVRLLGVNVTALFTSVQNVF